MIKCLNREKKKKEKNISILGFLLLILIIYFHDAAKLFIIIGSKIVISLLHDALT